MTEEATTGQSTEGRAEHQRSEDEMYLQRADEKALHEMVLDSIRHDLDQQPSPFTVITTARSWCNRITVAADEIAKTKRNPG